MSTDATAVDDVNEQLESEAPSTIKKGFQRWLVVAGVFLTLAFLWVFMSMTEKEKIKDQEVAQEQEVPDQIQEVDNVNQNAAIARFQREMSNSPPVVKQRETIEVEGFNNDFAPRATKDTTPLKRRSEAVAKIENNSEKSPYQQYIEAEQMRAFKSLSSESSLGDDSAFYGSVAKADVAVPKKSATMPPVTNQSIAQQRADVQDKIRLIQEYRQKIERGEIDASAPPPDFSQLLQR